MQTHLMHKYRLSVIEIECVCVCVCVCGGGGSFNKVSDNC